jgi:hypothetical protein
MLLSAAECRRNVGQLSSPPYVATALRHSVSIIDEPVFVSDIPRRVVRTGSGIVEAMAGAVASRRPMQRRPDPRRWVIIAHLEHAASRLDPVSGAPPRYKRAGQPRIEEINFRSSFVRIHDGIVVLDCPVPLFPQSAVGRWHRPTRTELLLWGCRTPSGSNMPRRLTIF